MPMIDVVMESFRGDLGSASADRTGWPATSAGHPDNRDLFVTVSPTRQHVVPTWSAAAPIGNLRLRSYHDVADTEVFIAALRTAPS